MEKIIKIPALVFFACLFIVSCKEPPRPQGAWYGYFTRNSDQRILSPVAMYFSGDTLIVYSNAITGKYTLYLRDKDIKEQGSRTSTTDIYKSPNSGIFFKTHYVFEPNEELQIEGVEGVGIKVSRNEAEANKFKNNEFLMSGSYVSPLAKDYLFGRFCGEMYRERDNRCLGPIVLESEADQLKIYCNYLFGKENVYSKRSAFGNSQIIYRAPQFQFAIWAESASKLILKCNGFVAKLNSGSKYDENEFFTNKTAIKNPDHYLVGNRYKGVCSIEGDSNELSRAASLTYSFFGIGKSFNLEMYFVDEETVQYEMTLQQDYSNLLSAIMSLGMNSSSKVETTSYHITDKGKIHWSKSDLDWEDLQILDHGKKLKMNNQEVGITGTLELVN